MTIFLVVRICWNRKDAEFVLTSRNMKKIKRDYSNLLLFQEDSKIYGHGNNFNAYTHNMLNNVCLNLYRKNLIGQYGCVNAINFSNGGDLLVSGGDDRRVLLWKISEVIHGNKFKPISLKTEHNSNIFCTVFDSADEHIFSSGNDETVIRHDLQSGKALESYLHTEAVYAVGVSPCDVNVFVTAGEDGTLQVYDVRDKDASIMLTSSSGAFHSVAFNPVDAVLIASANSVEGVSLWDIRVPQQSVFKYGTTAMQSAMSVCFDYTGRKILALMRRYSPVLFDIQSQAAVVFDCLGFNNFCTMKSACFAGEKDQFVVSGSDDSNIYLWKRAEVNTCHAHLVLQGHRSIVNQVRYNQSNHVLVSAGVEKCIKLWSPYPVIDGEGDITGKQVFVPRQRFTADSRSHLLRDHLTHNYDEESTEEDLGMLAFFDNIIERCKDSSDTSASPNDNFSSVLDILDNSGSTVDSPTATERFNETNPNYNDSIGMSIDELRQIFPSHIPSRTSPQEDNHLAGNSSSLRIATESQPSNSTETLNEDVTPPTNQETFKRSCDRSKRSYRKHDQ